MFVSCDVNGNTNRQRGAGKVVRCEDTDGDGKADRFTNFVEGIDSPRGSCYVGDTLYLMQATSLVAYRDLNDDGIAEKKTVLVRQLGQGLDGGGCHQRFGATSVSYPDLGSLLYIKGARPDGSAVAEQRWNAADELNATVLPAWDGAAYSPPPRSA